MPAVENVTPPTWKLTFFLVASGFFIFYFSRIRRIFQGASLERGRCFDGTIGGARYHQRFFSLGQMAAATGCVVRSSVHGAARLRKKQQCAKCLKKCLKAKAEHLCVSAGIGSKDKCLALDLCERIIFYCHSLNTSSQIMDPYFTFPLESPEETVDSLLLLSSAPSLHK